MAQIDNLEKFVPFVKSLNPDGVIYDLLANQLPVILQLVLLALVPITFANLSENYECKVTRSEVPRACVDRPTDRPIDRPHRCKRR
jgi:hypothetical protein